MTVGLGYDPDFRGCATPVRGNNAGRNVDTERRQIEHQMHRARRFLDPQGDKPYETTIERKIYGEVSLRYQLPPALAEDVRAEERAEREMRQAFQVERPTRSY